MTHCLLEIINLVLIGLSSCIFGIQFFLKTLFPFKIFLQQHENTIKSNDKNNNYINQLLRLPLLKHTHTHTHTEKNNTGN